MEGEVARVVLPGRAGLRGMSDELQPRDARGARRPRARGGRPLNPPVVLASNFRTYGYAREEGSPTLGGVRGRHRRARGRRVGRLRVRHGGDRRVLEPLPVGARVVGPPTATPARAGCWPSARQPGGSSSSASTSPTRRPCWRPARAPTLLWVETPTNPLIGIAELDRLCEGAHAAGAEVAVDATFATPLLLAPARARRRRRRPQRDEVHRRPLRPAARRRGRADERAGRRAAPRRRLLGATPGALEAFLALRGLRTLPVRLERGQATAQCSPSGWPAHPAVSAVHYPGLPADPGHERAAG